MSPMKQNRSKDADRRRRVWALSAPRSTQRTVPFIHFLLFCFSILFFDTSISRYKCCQNQFYSDLFFFNEPFPVECLFQEQIFLKSHFRNQNQLTRFAVAQAAKQRGRRGPERRGPGISAFLVLATDGACCSSSGDSVHRSVVFRYRSGSWSRNTAVSQETASHQLKRRKS